MKKRMIIVLLGITNLYTHTISFKKLKSNAPDPLTTRALTSQQEDFFLLNRPIIIGLGDSCQVALNLRYAKLRFMAYPFDWTVARFDDVYDMIENDFKHFQIPENFIQGSDPRPNTHTHNHYPELLFPHVKWEALSDDFNRRIKRFYKAIAYAQASHKEIHFVIHSLRFNDKSLIEKANKLHSLLAQKFPNLNFTLIVMHHAKDLDTSTNDECKFIYLQHEGWTETSYQEWRKKIAAIGLINSHAKIDAYSDHPFK